MRSAHKSMLTASTHAVVIDSTELSIEQVLERALDVAKARNLA